MSSSAQAVPRTLAKGYKGPAMEGFIATWYANNTRGEIRGFRETARAVAARLPMGATVLEVAPGPGYLAIELAKLGEFRVSGLDISHSFVRIATENAREAGLPIGFQQGNASRMPYADGSFDFVMCRAAFKNFADPVGALNEIHRVLKPGGQASIFDLRKESSPRDVRVHVESMGLSRWNAFLTRLTFRFFLLKKAYRKADMERLAAMSHFESCQVLSSGIEFDARFLKTASAESGSAGRASL